MPPLLTVIIPTHTPDPARLQRTFLALARQSCPADRWELLLVDNASSEPVAHHLVAQAHPEARVIHEPVLGLTHARLAGIAAAHGRILVFVDDDNLLAADYLTEAARLLEQHPEVAAAGGLIQGEFEIPPPAWAMDHLWSLAVRDYGNAVLISQFTAGDYGRTWPVFSPVGAGLVVRAEAAQRYAEYCAKASSVMTDRQGGSLGSAGDCELVMHAAFLSGAQVAYSPALRLTHLIPRERLGFRYHVRLAYQSGLTWGKFITAYGFQPRISRASLLLRLTRAVWRRAGWSRRGFIAWCSTAGEFIGRTSLT